MIDVHRRSSAPTSAFSLVEISIVLVILGLLVGGILTGKTLIHGAELRSAVDDFQRYQSAWYAYRDKYFYFPGDMPNATRFWGDRTTGPNPCPDSAVVDGNPGTCNGDGDGSISNYELWRTWQQLALAGIIPGSYAGSQTGWGSDAKAGVDYPGSRFPNGGYAFVTMDTYMAEFQFTGLANATHNFLLLSDMTNTLSNPLLTPEDAYHIDTKMDDGLPAKGKMWGGRPYNGCTTDNTVNAQYLIASTQRICILGLIVD